MKDLTNLRKIAEAATQGNWIPFEPGEEPGYWWVWLEEKLPWYGGIAQVSESDPGSICQTMITDSRDPAQDKADAVHIATFDPPTVLALIARLEQAEQEAKAAKGVITQHIAERSLETHRNVGIAVDEAVRAVVQLLIEDPSRRAREAEAVVARVREVATGDPTEYGWSEAMLAVLRALDGEPNE